MLRTWRFAPLFGAGLLLAMAYGCSSSEVTFANKGGGNSGAGAGSVGGDGGEAGQGTGATTNTTSSGQAGQGGEPLLCGNGVIDDDEQCDGADFGEASCKDLGYSNLDGLVCTEMCVIDDSNCKPTCDGQALEPDEDCDGAFFNSISCTDYGYSNPSGLVCKDCKPDAEGCKSSCDDKLLEPGEECDGADLNGADCKKYGFSSPAGLTCVGCFFDSSGCKPTCDGQLLESGEECDGNDLNGMSCKDFGYVEANGLGCDSSCKLDPGSCKAVCGNKEMEPGEECDDGNVDPADGCDLCKIAGGSCAEAINVTLNAGTSFFQGTTVGGGYHHASFTCSGEGGRDRVYKVSTKVGGFLTAALMRDGTSYNSMLYALTDCMQPSSAILCENSYDPFNNQNVLNGGEVISFPMGAGDTVYIIVDGYNNATGTYELALDLSAGTCADPVRFPLWYGTRQTAIGSTINLTDETATLACGGAGSADVAYELIPYDNGKTEAEIRANLTNFDSVVSVRSVCNNVATELNCDHNANGHDAVEFPTTANQSRFVFVDGWMQAAGDYEIRFDPAP